MAQRKPAISCFNKYSLVTRATPKTLAEEAAPRKASEYWLALLAALTIVVLVEWVTGGHTESVNADVVSSKNTSKPSTPNTSSIGLLHQLANNLNTEWEANEPDRTGDNLLILASESVANQDHQRFADRLRLLGMRALQKMDAGAATVYLDESLTVYEELEDELGIASVELLRAELNIKRRGQARRAAYAYDALQLARFKVAYGQFDDAVEQLNWVVSENLALNRFGAAAAAYQTLYKGYSENGQLFDAQIAGVEIVKLHASSGRPLKAQAMLETLRGNGLDEQSILKLQQTNAQLQHEYEESVTQIGQARDYQQLYNHFISAGDPVRAWQFRLKSQRSLRGVTQRAMHRQQTGVLALVYTSNDYMKHAQHSLRRAGQLFTNNDQQLLADVSAQMQKEVF